MKSLLETYRTVLFEEIEQRQKPVTPDALFTSLPPYIERDRATFDQAIEDLIFDAGLKRNRKGLFFPSPSRTPPAEKAKPSPVTSATETQLELDYEKKVIAYLGTHPRIRLQRQNSGSIPFRDRTGKATHRVKLAPPGSADECGWAAPYGIHLEVEFKVNAEQSDAQKAREATCNAMGCVYLLLRRDPDLDDQENNERALVLIEEAVADAEREIERRVLGKYGITIAERRA